MGLVGGRAQQSNTTFTPDVSRGDWPVAPHNWISMFLLFLETCWNDDDGYDSSVQKHPGKQGEGIRQPF